MSKGGDVVSVEFPFSELQGRKRRPGLVLLSEADDILLARLTTHSPRGLSDVALKHWAAVGLPRASTVRLTKLLVIDHRLIHHQIGSIVGEDAELIAQAWERMTSAIAAELRK